MHEIHTSERRSFRGCRRRWDWAYREGYVPLETPKPLEFGIAYHEALDVFFNPETWTTTDATERHANAVLKFTTICEEQRDKFLKVTGQRELENAQGDDYRERIELGIGMLTHYANEVHPKADDWFRPVATEIPFEVPLYYPGTNDPIVCSSSPHCGQIHGNDGPDSHVFYAGRVDMLIEDLRFGGYFVWDHKTASQLADDHGFLQLDDQVGSYVWALALKLGLDVKGFVYAEYRKDWPKPPNPLTRKMGGRSFSTAKNQATTLPIFQRHVAEFDNAAYAEGKYDEFIEWLTENAPKFHQRFIVIKSDRELEEIGKNLTLEALDMIEPDLRIYPSVGRYGCSNCAYREPCVAKFRGEDHIYTLDSLFDKVEHRYYNRDRKK